MFLPKFYPCNKAAHNYYQAMAHKKRQHFVPQCYLKSWTVDKDLYTIPLKDGIVRKQQTKEIAKKNHLYTLPSIFFINSESRNPQLQELITENLVLKIWEDRWPNVLRGLKSKTLSDDQIRDLKGFIIVQSFRTPKFLRQNKEIIERLGNPSDNMEDAFHVAFLGSQGLTEYLKNCVCEVIHCNDISNFITCDNPATHWLQNGDTFHYLPGTALNNDLFRNPRYKILCPLHPKYFGILTPNLGIEVPPIVKNTVLFKTVYSDVTKQFNQLTEYGADKMLFAKSLSDFS